MASFDLLDCLGISYVTILRLRTNLFVKRRRERVGEGRKVFDGGRRERREGEELIPHQDSQLTQHRPRISLSGWGKRHKYPSKLFPYSQCNDLMRAIK